MIQLILKGRAEAYSDLVRKYHKKVMGYCLSMLSNRTDAEEAAQDVFVKAYRSLPRFKGDSAFSTWLYRITANHCLDVLRKRNRRRTVSLDSLMEEQGSRIEALFASSGVGMSGAASPGGGAPQASAAANLENRDLADKILSTLPEDYRSILTLREAQGLEYQEIAEVLGCSLDAVKGRLARARRHLQGNLRPFLAPGDVYTDEK